MGWSSNKVKKEGTGFKFLEEDDVNDMRNEALEVYNDYLWSEFEMAYSDNDLLAEFCEENQITLTPETADNYDEEEFQEFKQHKFYEYKESRD